MHAGNSMTHRDTTGLRNEKATNNGYVFRLNFKNELDDMLHRN